MTSTETHLVLLPFLQKWDGDGLHLRLLLTPRDALIEPYVGGPQPWPPSFFPTATYKFTVRLKRELENLPAFKDGSYDGEVVAEITLPPVASAAGIFTGLKGQFEIDLNPPAAKPPGRVRKHLPLSYQDSSGFTPTESDMFTTDSTYACYLKAKNPNHRYKRVPRPKFTPSWGKIIASVIRIPEFAEKAGLVRECPALQIDPAKLEDGGFLFFTIESITGLDPAVIKPEAFKTYATRIPELKEHRELFTPVLFPILKEGSEPSLTGHTEIFAEVDEYVDGFAKTVHCIQPQQLNPIKEEPDGTRPVKDIGIRIGWDDEQVTKWLDRQLRPDNDSDSPLGVNGYRIDVRPADSEDWYSLTKGSGVYGDKLGPNNGWLGGFDDYQLAVEVHPVQSLDGTTESFWMPMYMTTWSGISLIGEDETSLLLMGRTKPTVEFPVKGVLPPIELRYGRSYEFRVRLMDHTGGGPQIMDQTSEVGPSPISRPIRFQRWIRPLPPRLTSDVRVIEDETMESAPNELIFLRPQLGWPAVQYTDEYSSYEQAKEQIMKIHRTNLESFTDENDQGPEATLPDPDANKLEISVWINTLPQDPLATDAGCRLLYVTKRQMPRPDLFASKTISFNWIDIRDIEDPSKDFPAEAAAGDFWNAEAADGPLKLPKARLLRLRVRTECTSPTGISANNYFGAEDVRFSPDIVIPLRKNAYTEGKLYTVNTDSHTISAYFLQPLQGLPTTEKRTTDNKQESSSESAVARLATELRLQSSGTTLRSQPGERVAFACSGAIRHVLGPDLASISFPADHDLIRQFIVVIRLTIERDWTWSGLKAGGIVVRRNDIQGREIVRFSPTYSAGLDAVAGAQTNRSTTELIILDALDPKPLPGVLPREQHLFYTIDTSYLVASPAAPQLQCDIRLPVAFAPSQTPKVTSVGFAMSPYTPDEKSYSFTVSRKRLIWVEFAEKLLDPEDRYFCRVLRYVPDPLLMNSEFVAPETVEPNLPIDSEALRRFVPDQANDNAALTAMQPMIPSTTSPYHWALPLPPGLDDSSAELFGFFTYEFRVGHYNEINNDPNAPQLTRWCTAQSRFGPRHRLAGVQHPFPELSVDTAREFKYLRISAPYAQPAPVSSIKPNTPSTLMAFLVYAQAAQIDGSGQYRNILLLTRYADPQSSLRLSSSRVVAYVDVPNDEIRAGLQQWGFEGKTGLSVLAVELENQAGKFPDPLGANLGRRRIIRCSCLKSIEHTCY